METSTALTAHELLEALGGSNNVTSIAMCMTRLRLELVDRSLADFDKLVKIHRVLSVRPQDEHGIEVVFGPAVVDAIAHEVSHLAHLPLSRKHAKAVAPLTAPVPSLSFSTHQESPFFEWDYQSSPERATLEQEDLEHLKELLAAVEDMSSKPDEPAPLETSRLLVLNGPNMNLLGVREPGIYGNDSYEDLVDLCTRAGQEAGFSEVSCYQSNHEGDLVDAIQEAYGIYDGIVMNPAAYTHTSVALLDALKAVGLPCVEVHVSKVPERESFRQVSFVRGACIASVIGEGLQGYVHAINILADFLTSHPTTISAPA